MRKYILFIVGFSIAGTLLSQERMISLSKSKKNNFILTKSPNSSDILEINTSLSYISTKIISTKSANYVEIESEGLMRSYDSGKPNIPVYSKLIELPLGASVKFTVLSYDEEIIDFAANGISQKIIPAQPSSSKNQDPTVFYRDDKTYNDNRYFNSTITSFEEAGVLRSARFGRIVINPIQYNPVLNKLRVLNNLRVKIEFVGSNHLKTERMKAKYSSELFNGVINNSIANPNLSSNQVNRSPMTYVIVADRMFESTLAPFIIHKQQMGYNIIVGFTDDPKVGSTTTSIKAYLKNIYDNPPSGYNPPQYVLLVGDVEQIPSFEGTAPKPNWARPYHPTDLYYFDYTGDNLPDVFYGRFSASNIAQLEPQIQKTLEYERYTMPDPTYLYKSVLVAGDEIQYELTCLNGQINYCTNQYCNSENGIIAYSYLQDEPSGGNYSTNIINNINNGAGFVNYTAHGLSSCWVNPRFSVSDIANLTNIHKYGLWVGNCCLSNKFSESECFGEAALRAANKGAVGYIGASNNSNWDEDFWWSVGFKPVSANPSYDANHLGAYDRLFHTHGESMDNWYTTQGQMVVAGNLAVQESTSSMKSYYWEIYHLLGDPSINIRTVPSSCQDNLNIVENISVGGERLAKESITASNVISNNANVHYGANNSVTLLPGFSVDYGSTFSADLLGCNAPSSLSPVSEQINEEEVDESIIKGNDTLISDNIFPNPTHGEFTVRMNLPEHQTSEIRVYDSMGKLVKTVVASATETLVSIEDQPAGIYLVRYTVDGKNQSAKIVKL
jgi:hypothetical protein